jgi:hypothetical protein
MQIPAPAAAPEPAATHPPQAQAVGSVVSVVRAAAAETAAGTPAGGGNIVLQPDKLVRLLVDARATHLVSALQGHWHLTTSAGACGDVLCRSMPYISCDRRLCVLPHGFARSRCWPGWWTAAWWIIICTARVL